jgi:uncharacterized membrane protein YfcA
MMDVTGWEWAVAVLGAVILGISKTGLPGVGILAIPMFAAIMPAKASTGIVLPMLVVADLFAVAVYRRHAEWSHLWRLFPWTIAGVVAGYFLMGVIDDRQLRPVIGAIVLTMLALNHWRQARPGSEPHIPTHMAFGATIGLLAGLLTMLANAAGPIMIIYLLAMRLPKVEFISTGAWYFFFMNLFKIPFSYNLGLINAESLRFNLVLVPAIVVGALLGFKLLRWIPEKPFALAMQILAAIGAVRLLLP